MNLKVAAVALALMLLETTAAGTEWERESSPYDVPRQQARRNHTVSNVRQKENKIADTFIRKLSLLTTAIQNVTKGATEKQLQFLNKFTHIIPSAMILGFQTGKKNLTSENSTMFDEIETFSNFFTTSLFKQPNTQASHTNTREPLPDYTHLLENSPSILTLDGAYTDSDLPLPVTEPQADSLFVESYPLYDSFPDNENQTPASVSSPFLKSIVPRPAKVRFSAQRVPASPQVTRPTESPSITNWGVQHFISSFVEEDANKSDQNTQAPRRQPTEKPLRSSTSKRRYIAPSRLLRQQMFGSYQSSSPPSTDTSSDKHTGIPLARSRVRRINVLRRRRLTTTLP